MPLTLRLLALRGILERAQAEEFLHFKESLLSDPVLLPGIDKATKRICQAILHNEKIVVYGDFDADGVTSVAIVTEGLRKLGAKVSQYLPDRFSEGYGLNTSTLETLASQGANLIITVDCGISSYNEIIRLNELSIDTIITDHHSLPERLPPAHAIINPHLLDNDMFKSLAGAGVAYKLVSYLYGYFGRAAEADEFLALAAIGTVADIMPLVKDNRYIVEMGLRIINKNPSKGLLELIRGAKLNAGDINASRIAWVIAPRLNAAGRLKHANLSYQLLTCQDTQEAMRLASQLDALNSERQALTNQFVQLAKEQVSLTQKILIFENNACPKGVVGLVAGRLCEEFCLPTIAVNTEGDLCVGSCRSIDGFNITQALSSCSELFVRFGGHAQAAGFTAHKENLPAIKDYLENYAREQLSTLDCQPTLQIDAIASLNELSLGAFKEIKRLEPFGEGNSTPIFLSENLRVLDWRLMGKGQEHIFIKFSQDERLLEATGFNLATELFPLIKESLDIVYNLEINDFNGRQTLRAKILDYKIHQG